MRILLTGATGVVGRATARALLSQGHSVSAFGQGAERARKLHLLGVTPIDVDLYDAPRLPSIMRDVDAVLHLATRIPPLAEMVKKRAWAENDRLRTIATGLLVDAALTAATKIFILHGITFIYVDRGAEWIDEGCPVDSGPALVSMLDAEAHVQRFTAAGRVGITLRNGLFYGPECQSVSDALELAKRASPPPSDRRTATRPRSTSTTSRQPRPLRWRHRQGSTTSATTSRSRAQSTALRSSAPSG